MPLEIELVASGKRLLIRRLSDGWTDKIDPESRNARLRVARALGVSEPVVLAWIVKGHGRHLLADDSPLPGEYLVRPITAGDDTAERFTDWRAALQACPVEGHVMTWTGEQLACLDVDYHGVRPPDKSWLEGIVCARLAPRPILWHFSRGGGLHCFYEPAGPFAAEELASIAALRYRTIDPTAGVETKRIIRGSQGVETFTYPTQDTAGSLNQWVGVDTVDESDVADWLSDNGLERGKRYGHDSCPIHPTDDPGVHRDPVTVGDAGIYCHVCAGHGYGLGNRKAGFAPYSVLLGTPSSGDVGRMIRNLCHWGHAKWIFTERYDMPEGLARKAYSAACKAYHHGKPTEPLVPGIFHRDTADMARVNKSWMSLEQSYIYQKEGLSALLSVIPAVQSWNEDKLCPVSSPSAVAELSQGKDLSARGFPDIEVIHGYRFTRQYMPPADRTTVSVTHPDVRHTKPRYDRTMPEDRAWAVLETYLPGLDHNLIKLVLCSLGCTQETRLGMTPLIFVTGPAGAAKTTTVRVGAAIAGVKSWDVVFDDNTSRFREGFVTAVQATSIIMVNEVLKDAERSRSKQSARQALDTFLNMTPTASSHVSYRGSVQMGRLPAIFLTEPVLPQHIREETQIARRLRHVRLYGRKDGWKQTLPPLGITPDDMHKLRGVSPEIESACNSILAAVTDEFFQEPIPFDKMADQLGAKTVEESDDFEDVTPYLREFFRQVCQAPAITNERLKAKYSNGYKRIVRQEDSMLTTLYGMFADGPGADWTTSRKLSEKDWSGVLKTDYPVQLDQCTDGSSVYCRFRVGPLKLPLVVNERIVDPAAWEEDV